MRSKPLAAPSRSFNLITKSEDGDPVRESVVPLMSFDKKPDEKAHLARRGPPKTKISGRKHCHIVFEQVATPISQLISLSDVFLVLKDVAKGVFRIFLAGLF